MQETIEKLLLRQKEVSDFAYWNTESHNFQIYHRNDLNIHLNSIFNETSDGSNCSLGFYHQTSHKLNALEYTISNIRQYYPDSFYILIADRGPEYHDLCEKYNVELLQSQIQLGYPVGDYGYRKQQVLELLKRIYVACIKTNTTHLMYVEDDVILYKKQTLRDDWHLAAYNPVCDFDLRFYDILGEHSGVTPNVRGYGTPGGTIFNVKTYIKNYFMVVEWVERNFDIVQNNIYPTIGWIDCVFTWFFLLSGEKYSVNRHLYQNWCVITGTQINFQHNHPVEPEVLHGFKKYY
jgi:hypothetical protein